MECLECGASGYNLHHAANCKYLNENIYKIVNKLESDNCKLQKQSDLLTLGLLQEKNKVAALEKEIEGLKKIIQKYGCHDYECNESGKAECICGFEQAMKA